MYHLMDQRIIMLLSLNVRVFKALDLPPVNGNTGHHVTTWDYYYGQPTNPSIRRAVWPLGIFWFCGTGFPLLT